MENSAASNSRPRLAGLKVERLVNEPTAAALAYGLGDTGARKLLVFDLGGGTFDVSILHTYEGVMEVRATAGDTHLGGEDFTSLVEHAIAAQQGVALKGMSAVDRARLRRTAERAKLDLTGGEAASYRLTLGDTEREGTVARAAFETDCANLLRRLRLPVERAIRDARLTPADLDGVVMVGGATRMPMVRSLVARLFGRLPLVHIDPDQAVARCRGSVRAGGAGLAPRVRGHRLQLLLHRLHLASHL